MEISDYKLIWTETAQSDLKNIFDFVKKKSVSGAKNVIFDIQKAANSAYYSEQYQKEEYYPEFRRIIVRNYKLIYETDKMKKEIIIIRVFDTRQDPKKIRDSDN